ncbi:glycosyltransferase family 2 protein [Corynebacterium sanguinis]|nr:MULTISPECIES: glycosyltransferase family 2 protein [Corynebacterium]MCT2023713.1 glycosyltransferase family 2 protein [Corynebacterium sanguinis]MDN8577240.1 glycosyltransferase family 2 protein [Corynebacterium sanguinis]
MNTPAKPLAVITVTYSPGRHLRFLDDTVRSSTKRPVLLVCADNGSSDGSPEQLAAGRDDVDVFSTGGNIGYGGAINAAVKRLARRRQAGEIDPDYLLITNPDVRFSPGSVDELLARLAANPRAGAAGPRIEEADGSIYPSAREVPGLLTGIGHALLVDAWPNNPFTRAYRANSDMGTERTAGWLSGACLLVRWEAFEDIGGFDERYFMYLEDIDFGDRLSRAGWDNLYCPSSVIMHDQGHVAGKHTRVTVPAHHKSAYRFQADRHPAWWQGPIRLALWLGLWARGILQQTKGS